MKIEITEYVKTPKIIEVELPYYYKHDLMSDHGDSIIYGNIEEKLHLSIHETKQYSGEEKYEVEWEEHDSIKHSGAACYFDEKYKSSKKEFYEVKERFLSFSNRF